MGLRDGKLIIKKHKRHSTHYEVQRVSQLFLGFGRRRSIELLRRRVNADICNVIFSSK